MREGMDGLEQKAEGQGEDDWESRTEGEGSR